MANIELIRKLHFKEGRSIRQLSKDLKLSRQTIRKALQQNEIPTYQRTKPVANPVIDPVKYASHIPLKLQLMGTAEEEKCLTILYSYLDEALQASGILEYFTCLSGKEDLAISQK